MKKRILSIVLLSISFLLVLGAGVHDAGLAGAAPGDGSDDEFNNIDWDNPGSLQLTKEAAPVEGTHNRWKITLGIEGIDEQKDSDVVLVIDTSGSMQGSRMTSAIAAAKNFVNTLLDEGDTHTRIALVSFAGDVKVHGEGNPFKGAADRQILLNAINGLRANGGTFTQGGLKNARDVIGDYGRPGAAKYVVLLSDGEPTYSYKINNITTGTGWQEAYFEDEKVRMQVGTILFLPIYENVYCTKDDLDQSVFVYTGSLANHRVGGGSLMVTQVTGSYYYHHGNSAVAESRFIKELSDTTIYSIGFELGATGQDIMDRVATEGKSFSATEANLQTVFHEIAGSISHAATGAVVTDPLGDMFSLVGNVGSIIVSDGTTVSYEEGTITWTIGEIQQGSPPEMSYIVEIDPSALSGVLYPTNKATYVDYTNIDGQSARKQFLIPKVGINAIGVIEITKEFAGTGGDANKQFAIYVEGEGHTWSMLLAAGQLGRIAGLSPGTYTIREVVPMGYKLVGISPLEVTFTAADLNEVKKVTVTNKKTGEPWFHDDDDKVNEFKMGTW